MFIHILSNINQRIFGWNPFGYHTHVYNGAPNTYNSRLAIHQINETSLIYPKYKDYYVRIEYQPTVKQMFAAKQILCSGFPKLTCSKVSSWGKAPTCSSEELVTVVLPFSSSSSSRDWGRTKYGSLPRWKSFSTRLADARMSGSPP